MTLAMETRWSRYAREAAARDTEETIAAKMVWAFHEGSLRPTGRATQEGPAERPTSSESKPSSYGQPAAARSSVTSASLR